MCLFEKCEAKLNFVWTPVHGSESCSLHFELHFLCLSFSSFYFLQYFSLSTEITCKKNFQFCTHTRCNHHHHLRTSLRAQMTRNFTRTQKSNNYFSKEKRTGKKSCERGKEIRIKERKKKGQKSHFCKNRLLFSIQMYVRIMHRTKDLFTRNKILKRRFFLSPSKSINSKTREVTLFAPLFSTMMKFDLIRLN